MDVNIAMDFYLISVLVFALIIVLILYKDRKNVRRESIIFLRRTTFGKEALTKLGNRFPTFWKVVGNIGVIACFAASLYIVFWLVSNLIQTFTSQTAVSGLAFVLPAPTSTANMGPGYLLVPFWYWIISIGLLVLVHEGFHGIMSAREKVKIKSLGWGVLAIIPLAFVEPDEKQLEKRKSSQQLRVYAAGSFANFLLAGVCLLIITFAFTGFFMSSGVGYQAVIKDYPAEYSNLTGKIVNINGYDIKNIKDLDNTLTRIGSHETIVIKTMLSENESKDFILTTTEKPLPQFEPSVIDDFVVGFDVVIPGTIEFAKSLGQHNEDWTSLQIELQYWQFVKEYHPLLKDKADRYIYQIEQKIDDADKPGFIGVLGVYDVQQIKAEFIGMTAVINFLGGLLFFLFLINLGVGLANLMPIGPLDGGKMWSIVLKKYEPKRSKKIMSILSWSIFILLIGNFILPMIL